MALRICIAISLAIVCATPPLIAQQPADGDPAMFAKDNLVAWCIVPFDAKQRGPSERAEMVRRLGLSRVAYDWRKEHVASFEEEILQYKKHGIEYFAFWSWHDDMEPLIRKHAIKPQVWQTCPSPPGDSQEERVKAVAAAMLPLVGKTRQLGLKLGLYNHGGWGGEPANLVAVCNYLREHHDADHVGIVYNFHHGHQHMEGFSQSLKAMTPFLLCVNLNGMADAKNVAQQKILPVGSGIHEKKMIQSLLRSGYRGRIGVLGHRSEMDVEEALRLNLDGLASLIEQL